MKDLKIIVSHRTANALAEIDRARGYLSASLFSPDWLARMQQGALVKEAHYTTHIEGTQITLQQAGQLWLGCTTPEVNPDDARELLNYRRAYDLVIQCVEDRKPITEVLIRNMQSCLVSGVRGDEGMPGCYRSVQNYVVRADTKEVIYEPPPAFAVPGMMAELVDWAEMQSGQMHPVLVSAVIQFQLVHIHPFMDGNGRTARLLSTLYLYAHGYDFNRLFSLSEYYDRDREAYYRAIQNVRDCQLDMSGWLEYFARGLAAQLQEVGAAAQRCIEQPVRELSLRQRKVMEYLEQHGRMTIQDLEWLCPGVSRRTLQRELRELVDRGVVVSVGSTNRLVYRLSVGDG